MPKLNNEKYIKQLFIKKLIDIYPNIKDFDNLEIYPIKKSHKRNYFHVVNYYVLKNKNGKTINIIGAAHSDGSRKKVFQTLKYLYSFFKKGELRSVKPLFYLNEEKAMFYESIQGPNLLEWLKLREPLGKILPMSASWLAKLHCLPPPKHLKVCRFDKKFFDPSRILKDNSTLVKKYRNRVENYLELILTKKPKLSKKLVFCHGDAHPENVIRSHWGRRVAFIDFSNACLSSPAFDIGSFMAQLNFMGNLYYSAGKSGLMSKHFLIEYLKKAKIKNKKNFEQELVFFQSWIALKGMLYYLKVPNQKRAKRFEKIFLNLKKNN